MDNRFNHYKEILEDNLQEKLPIVKQMGEQALDWVWLRRLEHAYDISTNTTCDPYALRFLFGISGSGVGWIADILVHSSFKVKLWSDPLLTFKPKPNLTTILESTTYEKSLPPEHPMMLIPTALTKECTTKHHKAICLIQQTKMLPHIEPMLRQQKIRSIFVLDDPVRILDHLLMSNGAESKYLQHESSIVFDQSFIARFMPSNRKQLTTIRKLIKRIPDPMEQNLLRQVVTIALIQQMFKAFASHYPKYAKIISTEELRYHPSLFIRLAQWVYGKKIMDTAITRLKDLTFVPTQGTQRMWKSIPFSNNSGKPKRLSAIHASACYRILEDAGLPQDDKIFIPDHDKLKSSLYYKQLKKTKKTTTS